MISEMTGGMKQKSQVIWTEKSQPPGFYMGTTVHTF